MKTNNIDIDRENTYLSDDEIAHLIRLARRDNPVIIALGGRLLPDPENNWAFVEIEKLRCGDYSI